MIAVVGAGLGGLVLARILHVHGVDVEVYEADPSPAARHQGGMLDIHEESGQAALRAAGLHGAFLALTFPQGDALRIVDKTGRVWAEEDGDGRRPEVERGALRDLLLSSLPDGVIRWGARVAGVRRAGGRWAVAFVDGEVRAADVVVGADGAWSKVRALLTDARPRYAGLSFVETRVPDADVRHPELAAVAGRGMLFALSDGKGILAHWEPDGAVCAYVALRAPAEWHQSGVTRGSLLEHFADWHPPLRGLIADSDGALVPRPLYALPVAHRWARVPGATLLGDAAHLMSPFAGEGANLAMQDGAELALAFVRHPGDVEAALADYEAAMFPRGAAAAAESAANLALCFGPGGARALAAQMARYAAAAEG